MDQHPNAPDTTQKSHVIVAPEMHQHIVLGGGQLQGTLKLSVSEDVRSVLNAELVHKTAVPNIALLTFGQKACLPLEMNFILPCVT